MAQKNSLTLEQFKSLCDYDAQHDLYVSKSGQDYIDALGKVFPLNNRNDKPFTIEDIVKQPVLSDFTFPGVDEFKLVCKLQARPLNILSDGKRVNEKILPFDFTSAETEALFSNVLGVAYILTCVINGNEHIIKIGCSRTTFKMRLGSYNCGVVNNWRTASTTNIKILQSMVTTRATFNLYLCDGGESTITYTWHGVESVPFASPKYLAMEDILVKAYTAQFNEKPLANVQANASEV